MLSAIAILLIIIFLFLSGLHIYWGLGGKWGSAAVLPTKDDNEKIMMPGIIPTFTVASCLLFFGFIVLLDTMKTAVKLPLWLENLRHYGLWAIAVIFILRAVGEFNYLGFFKKHRNSKFGKNDSRIYSPLCMTIGILTGILAWHV
jgi:hypothetical protein